MNDFPIKTKHFEFTKDESAKFEQIMPQVEYLLRYSRLGEFIKDGIIMPEAFRLRILRNGTQEKTISLFQMLQQFNSLQDESQAFLDFLATKKSASFIFDNKTRTIRLLREKLRKACLRNKKILQIIDIAKTDSSSNKQNTIAHHWDIKSNNFDAIYHILSDCSEVIDCEYSPSLTISFIP